MPTAQARTEIVLGTEALERLRESTVMVAGLGGVGGYCAEALARGGIGKMILLDHDVISPSNLNRQLLALNSTLGMRKTEVMTARLRDINPEIKLVVLQEFLRADGSDRLLEPLGQIDFLADCIDSIACKAALVDAAQRREISVISAMGAGNRVDVRQAKIKTLNQTSGCPLARELRKSLKLLGANLRYPVVFSDEPRRQPLPHQPIAGAEPGRARAVNGTVSYMPGLFGLMMAGHILHALAEPDNHEQS
ncbi:tRNA threonylcarbamoyladenosine dehydratase [Suttonella sp. R2A3]|uniref:tRNA threonylcarbamoyladenosine dehydratase n=1 Tax=Suttonella sp. R2A3 TaxID=2908648 RepID=UPI001F32E149|nr:tRNA threonylcarbamoyladenosine dehydratase [Suttonella sp. R2A3]UJF24385.1 tRNA threonylcarbamoyladenosine dehydratase [Suttonella sp. R2A3]